MLCVIFLSTSCFFWFHLAYLFVVISETHHENISLLPFFLVLFLVPPVGADGTPAFSALSKFDVWWSYLRKLVDQFSARVKPMEFKGGLAYVLALVAIELACSLLCTLLLWSPIVVDLVLSVATRQTVSLSPHPYFVPVSNVHAHRLEIRRPSLVVPRHGLPFLLPHPVPADSHGRSWTIVPMVACHLHSFSPRRHCLASNFNLLPENRKRIRTSYRVELELHFAHAQ